MPSLKELLLAGEKVALVVRYGKCDNCNGAGSFKMNYGQVYRIYDCQTCGGSGKQELELPLKELIHTIKEL